MAKTLTIGFIFIFSLLVEASPRREAKRFNKCFSILTQTSLKPGNLLLEKVMSSKISGSEACMQVLKSAELSNDGNIRNPKTNDLGKKVLRSFQSFHSSWFPNFLTYMTDDSPIIHDIIELEEPAFYLTKALFNDEWNYRDILKGSESYRGVRQGKHNPYFLIGTSSDEKIQTNKKYKVAREKGKKELFWSPTPLSRGKLIGIEKNIKNQDILPAHGHQLFFPTYYEEPLDIHKSLGGGFMGTNSYLLFNNGRPHGERTDGQVVMFRSYSKYLLKDILCRDLPVVTKMDAKPYVRFNSAVSWSNSDSCMSCHATIDPLASLLRNAELVVNDVPGQGSSHMKFHDSKFSLPDTYKLYDEHKNFHLSRPDGNFYYRDIEGKLFDKRVGSLDELGVEMSKTLDLYACAVSRYFYFFTGEEVPITNFKQNSPKNKFLLNLTRELKSHQKTKTIVSKIISSRWFLN